MRGVDLSSATPDQVLASGIAHVPEGRGLFPGMSVKNNLLMGAYLRRDKQIRKDLDFVFNIFFTEWFRFLSYNNCWQNCQTEDYQ